MCDNFHFIMTFDYESWIKAAEERLETLYEQKEQIEEEIGNLEKGIEGFSPLLKRPTRWLGSDTGITEAVTAVLKSEFTRLFTPPEIRDKLLAQGVPLNQKNPLATIHQVLSRLVNREIVKVVTIEPGRNRYQWADANAMVAEIQRSAATGKAQEAMRRAMARKK